MQDVAVIMSIYGNFDCARLKTAILALKEQKDINLDIIVSEQNLIPAFINEAKRLGVRYVHSEPLVEKGHQRYNTGRIRNFALAQVRAELVYLNDSDILFKNPHYLKRLTEMLLPEQALVKPPMRRIPQEDVSKFIDVLDNEGLCGAVAKLYFPGDYIATMQDKDPQPIKVVKHKQRTYTADLTSFNNYKTDPSLKGLEPTIFYDIVHCGGVFTTIDLLAAIGGYCEKYWTWGCEDADIQWKLGAKFNVIELPRDPMFEVLHMDHKKDHYSVGEDLANRQVFSERQSHGVDAAIKYDKEKNVAYKGK